MSRCTAWLTPIAGILSLLFLPPAARALRTGPGPRLVDLIQRGDDLALVRPLEPRLPNPFAPNPFEQIWTLELVRSAGPRGAIPTEGWVPHAAASPQSFAIAARESDGRWRLYGSVTVGGKGLWAGTNLSCSMRPPGTRNSHVSGTAITRSWRGRDVERRVMSSLRARSP